MPTLIAIVAPLRLGCTLPRLGSGLVWIGKFGVRHIKLIKQVPDPTRRSKLDHYPRLRFASLNEKVYSAAGMYFTYTLILTVVLVLSFPYYLFRLGKYLPTLPDRAG